MQKSELIFSSSDAEDFNQAVMPIANRQSFNVKFGTGYGYRRIAPNSFSFYGKGAISFQQEAVKISGKRHRLFRFGVPEEHTFRRADICNARAIGKVVRFDVHLSDDFVVRQVGFIAPDVQTARDIVGLLPSQQTEAFSLDQTERSSFHTRLSTISPGAPVTPIIVGVNIVIFMLMALNGGGIWHPDAGVAIRWGSNYGPLTLEGQWWRLLTSTFIHFGILHVTFNMLALYQTGRMVERIYGGARFLLLYLFAGLCGSVVSLLWHPAVNSAGASGAIFGVFGALLAFMINPRNAVPSSIMTEHRNSTVIFIGYNLLNGFTHAGIDNGAHIGGLLGGIAMGFMLARPLEIAARAKPATLRLALSCVAGILALGALSYPLAHPSEEAIQERNFNAVLSAFGPQEKKVLTDTNDLTGKIKAKSIDAAAFAEAIEQKITPQWEHLYAAMAAPTLAVQSKNYRIQQAFLRYLHDRIMVNKFSAESIRTNDRRFLAQAIDCNKDIARQLDIIRTLTAR